MSDSHLPHQAIHSFPYLDLPFSTSFWVSGTATCETVPLTSRVHRLQNHPLPDSTIPRYPLHHPSLRSTKLYTPSIATNTICSEGPDTWVHRHLTRSRCDYRSPEINTPKLYSHASFRPGRIHPSPTYKDIQLYPIGDRRWRLCPQYVRLVRADDDGFQRGNCCGA